MKISEYLKLERHKRCLTQEEMASKLGVNRTTYVTYEKSWVDGKGKKRVPGIKVAKKLAKLTGCSAEFINQLIENERKEQ